METAQPFRLTEVFYSLQGEGLHIGKPAVFVRFAGCNQKCTKATVGFDCDTDYRERGTTDIDKLVEMVRAAAGRCRYIVLTGGEPGLQVTDSLIARFHDIGFRVGIESNGTTELPLTLDWVTVSPKPADKPSPLPVIFCNEFKLVLAENMRVSEPSEWGVRAEYKLLSPAFNGLEPDPAALRWCIDWVLDNPSWLLTYQAHKVWGVR
jgi:organic radical activating enzyme